MFLFRKNFPPNLLWFNHTTNPIEFRTNYSDFSDRMGAIGLFPKDFVKRLKEFSDSDEETGGEHNIFGQKSRTSKILQCIGIY